MDLDKFIWNYVVEQCEVMVIWVGFIWIYPWQIRKIMKHEDLS